MNSLFQFICLVCVGVSFTTAETPMKEDELKKQLFTGYDKDEHPSHGKYPVNVSIGLSLIQINELDEWKEHFSTEIWMRLVWTDPRLGWDDNVTHIHVLRLPCDQVWVPKLEVLNSVNSGFQPIWKQTNVLIYPNGEVLWVPPGTVSTVCKTDIYSYPYDKHTCDIEIGPQIEDKSLITMGIYNDHYVVDLSDFWAHNTWQVLETPAFLSERKDPCCKDSIHTARFSITVSRNSEFYKHVLVIPCLITIILTAVIFLLPPHAGERIVLGSFTLLTLIITLLYLGWKLPPSRDSVPKIVSFCGVMAIDVVIAIIVSVFAINKTRSHQISSPPPLAISVLRGPLSKLLCLCHHKSPETSDSNPLEGSSEEPSTYHRDWQDFLLVLDRILLIVYLFVMIITAMICFL